MATTQLRELHNQHCTVCDEDCRAIFTCQYCHVTVPICNYRVGGFESTGEEICVACYEEREIAPGVLARIRWRQRQYDKRNKKLRSRSSSASS